MWFHLIHTFVTFPDQIKILKSLQRMLYLSSPVDTIAMHFGGHRNLGFHSICQVLLELSCVQFLPNIYEIHSKGLFLKRLADQLFSNVPLWNIDFMENWMYSSCLIFIKLILKVNHVPDNFWNQCRSTTFTRVMPLWNLKFNYLEIYCVSAFLIFFSWEPWANAKYAMLVTLKLFFYFHISKWPDLNKLFAKNNF